MILREFVRVLRAAYNLLFHRDIVRARLDAIHYDGHQLDVRITHPGVALIATSLAEYYDSCGGPNCATLACFDPATLRTFEISIRPMDRPSLGEINTGLRRALQFIYECPATARERARDALELFGYPLAGEIPINKSVEKSEGSKDVKRTNL